MDVEMDVDSGAISRGVVRGDPDPVVVVGVGVGVGVDLGADVGVPGSDPPAGGASSIG
jgi:hypothetical protein